MLQPLPPPLRPPPETRRRLQFRLHGFTQYESTDSGGQGARDEVTPQVRALMLYGRNHDVDPKGVDTPQTLRIEEHGAIDVLLYDWHIEVGE